MSDDRVAGPVMARAPQAVPTREDLHRLVEMIGLFSVLPPDRQMAVIEWLKRHIVH